MSEEAEKLETEKLVAAIHAGDASAIRGAGKSVAELVDGSTKKSALSLAACLGNVEVVKALITEGAADSTAAGQAAFNGHIDVLTHLLEAGGAEAATATDPLSGLTPLMQAALKGHSPCVAKVLAAAPESLHATDALGRTALMLAAMSGNAETVRMLAEHGSKLNATSREGRTALMWAVIAHKYRAVEALALLGADPEVREVASSGLIKPGGEEAPKSAMDHASARSGKDPVLIFIRDYLIAWEKAREAGEPTPTMEEPGWVTHACEVAAQEAEEQEARVEEVSTGGGGASAGDIWEDEEEDAPAEAEAPAEAAQAAPPVESAEGFTPSSSFAGARVGQVFKAGAHGLGYYPDSTAAASSPSAPAAPVEEVKKVSFADAPAPAAPSNLDELD